MLKIQYESTIDEAVDVQMRLLRTSKTAKKWKLQELIWAPLLFIGFYLGIPDEQNIKLIFSPFKKKKFFIFFFFFF